MTRGWAACISSARAPPNSTVVSWCTRQDALSGPKNPTSLATTRNATRGRVRFGPGSTRLAPELEVAEQAAGQELLALVRAQVVVDRHLLAVHVERERGA